MRGKFFDYLLGSKFYVYTDNSPLAYFRESKLGALQIWWLSELALCDFTINYQTRRSNKATNVLSRLPPEDDSKIESGWDCNKVEVISYSSVCEVVDSYFDTTKISDDLMKEALSINCTVHHYWGGRCRGNLGYAKLCVCSQSGYTWGHGRRIEERPYHWISLSLCYSWRKIKIISHCKDQIKGCTEIFSGVWQATI